jgi:copper chaperone CopZ
MMRSTLDLTAPDISCGKCKQNIEGDLAGEAGILSVEVAVAEKGIHIVYDDTLIGPEALRSKLADIGYPAAQ